MPFVAYDTDNQKLEFAARLDPGGNYVCPECRAGVSPVRSYIRNDDTRVRSFFRYYQCPHRGVSTVKKSGSSGGAVGGGENDKHKKRKYDALNEALAIFPDATYALEEQIKNEDTGEIRQPDAKLVFATPNGKYGKGLVIEYQNKNESKDRKAVQEFFAKEEFTTIWLWDEQFDYSGKTPDIDLYGGEVYTPWPDAVPKRSDWRDIGFARKQFNRWQRAGKEGVKSVKVPATFIRKWFVPTQAEYWKGTFKFTAPYRAIDHITYLPRWKIRFPDYNGYKADHYRLQAAIPTNDTSLRVLAKIPKHWYWPTPKEYWNKEPWLVRFRGSLTDQEDNLVGDYKPNVAVKYVNKWVLGKPAILRDRMGYPWESDKRVDINCPDCGARLKTDERYTGEKKRVKRCPTCTNWFDVFEHTDQIEFVQ